MEAGIRPIAVGIVAAYLLAGAGVLAAAWLRTGRIDQPATLAIAGLALIAGLVMAALLSMMRDPRGMVFFGVFFGLVVLPQVLAFGLFPDRLLRQDPLPAPAGTPAPERIPGADAPLQVTDLTPGVLDARRALLSVYADGSQVIEVIYDGEAQARLRFLAEYQNQPPPLESLGRYSGVLTQEERHASFHAVDGRRLLRITAVDRAILEHRLRGMDAPPPGPAASAAAATPPEPPVAVLAAALVLYSLFVAWVFLRLATWAASHAAMPGVPVQTATALRQRLLRLGRQDLPFTVRPGDAPQELIAEWRHAEATWLDLMRLRHVNRVVRYRLRLDEDRAQVRVREFQAAFDASAGAGGADLSYRATWGVSFFDRRVEGVLGLQLRDGKPTGEIAHAWRFDIDEMRSPLVQVITAAGWEWRHVLVDARWL
ncbi:hypothetical protein C3942_16025 [Solimonas fluminis]|uniref:DUF4178 domain-containing protein n=1 Tax=Solimonas fluminis TaxID=2086571 RepID=A0A2S5TD52_9GAMM|nr:hypothetical protein [Solimonas fluminis]PPE72930.1 hypothetical protein C3942_16025 [Solimonas fluminis]